MVQSLHPRIDGDEAESSPLGQRRASEMPRYLDDL